MSIIPDKDSFVAKLGRSFEEVYLLEQMSVVSIPLPQLNELITRGKTKYAEKFGQALHFDKAMKKLVDEGLAIYVRNTAYELTGRGKQYVKENGILERAIQSVESENADFTSD